MKNKGLISLLLLLFMLIITGCSNKQTDQSSKETADAEKTETIELTISAAASLEDAMNEMKPLFEQENKNIKIFFNYGGSGSLQKQIIQGAPVDIFFSAAKDQYNELVTKGIIDKTQGKDLLENSLVLIIPKESKNRIKGFKDLTNFENKKLALGTPEAVPAGMYGKQTLENMNIWNQVENHLVFAKDVRQVLTYVETGNVDAGIVYKTDALSSDKVEIVEEANKKSHDPIVYPVGIVKGTIHMQAAESFFQFLQKDSAKEIFEKYGFIVTD
ncbi:molybdate ABC transporter substrate-binding protein [Cytobacillus praedii]|uniref:Molybdate ABC transporter substrate-binding protein n=1 Tax=Cytobacillus praedii TaxID=1742358 RepID=A0A4R1ATS6_9BACI|nr:molybdate ABC transporter substrate-binding protein [Cytobacillus praedii]TCJ03477.1 molybdate ABC transporter substrate-binding protein [Cytobacillus praedii]